MDLGNYGIGGNEVKIDASEGIAEIPQNRTLLVDFSNVFRIKEVVMRMFELVPVPVITDFLLVLFTKSLPFYAITFRKHTDAHRSRFNLLLLKKRRTQN